MFFKPHYLEVFGHTVVFELLRSLQMQSWAQ